jgi:hypothetical protein
MSAIYPNPWAANGLSVADVSWLLFEKNGDISLAKSPLFALLEGGQNVFSGELVDRIRADVQNDRYLLAVKQLLFSLQHSLSPEQILDVPDKSLFYLARSSRAVKVITRISCALGTAESALPDLLSLDSTRSLPLAGLTKFL